MIKCGVITTSRADYGILRPLLRALENAPDFTLELYVSGSHLEAEHGKTETEILKDGFAISARVPLGAGDADAQDIAKRMARCCEGFAHIYAQNQPDIIVALGDRYEMFAAVSASVPFNIPVAHLHGGELTEGAQDEVFRHAITKMAHLHFAATDIYTKRIIQMGEDPARCFNVGALAVDGILATKPLSKQALCDKFQLDWDSPPILVTVHAETRAALSSRCLAKAIFDAVAPLEQTIIITYPNADSGSHDIMEEINAFKAGRARTYLVPSFGAQAYYSILRHVAVVVGNSSSGILETPALGVPTINVGDRQKGRLRADCIIDTPVDRAAIQDALSKALSDDFKAVAKACHNPFGDGTAAQKILAAMRGVEDMKALATKAFHDM